jgi:uncharacterized membrane protein YqjE
MIGTRYQGSTLGRLFRKTVSTGLGALQNRGELFLLELEEEKARLLQMLFLSMGAVFLGMMTILLLTGTIIFLVPEKYRVYVAAGFTALYLAVTLWALFSLKMVLKEIPFGETMAQVKKDRELLETLQ